MEDDLRPRSALNRALAVAAVVALVVAACGDAGDVGDAGEPSGATTTIAATTTTEVPTVTSEDGQTPQAADPTTTTSSSGDVEPAPGAEEGQGSSAPGDTPAPVADTGSKPVPSGDPAGPVDERLAAFVARAVTDLSGRLGVPEGEITILRAEMVVWPDSSRGCPQPDMRYLQVLTDGVWIVLGHGGASYRYITDRTGAVTLCESPLRQRPAEASSPGSGDA